MEDVRWSFDRLDDFVRNFAVSSHQKDTLYPYKVTQWDSVTFVSSRFLRHFKDLIMLLKERV